MASLPARLIFPSWCLQNIETGDEFSTDITPSRGGEASNANWSESRWVIDLSNGLCPTFQLRYLKAFNRAIMGRRHLFWYRKYGDEEWELNGPDGQGELMGIGDGQRTRFQARIYDEVQGKPAFLNVYALDHDIEPLGLTVNHLPATKTRRVEVFVDGQLQTEDAQYLVARDGGLITFRVPPPPGAPVKIRGGFFAVVRMNQESIRTAPASAGWWRVSNDVQLVQPKTRGQVEGA